MRRLLALGVFVVSCLPFRGLDEIETPAPLEYAQTIWLSRFPALPPHTLRFADLPQGRAGEADCDTGSIEVSPNVDPVTAVYVALHEMTHLALGCQATDHDPTDPLMVPEYPQPETHRRVLRILGECYGSPACVNDALFSVALRDKIEKSYAER